MRINDTLDRAQGCRCEYREPASAGEAAQRVKRVVELGIAVGVSHFYKKTDSTLRGNIGGELEAFMVALGHDILPFIPAFPKLGRTTSRGFQYVDNSLLNKTGLVKIP